MENTETKVTIKEVNGRNAKLVISNARASFPQLFTPKSVNGGPERYGINLFIPINSEADKAVLQAIHSIAKNELGETNYKQWLQPLWNNTNKNSYRTGTRPAEEGQRVLAAYRNAEKQGAPVVVDRSKIPLTIDSPKKPYSGCYINASVDIYLQTQNNPGIRCGLVAVQMLRDGPALGNDSPATADDFETLEDDGDISAFGDNAASTIDTNFFGDDDLSF